MVLSNKEPLQSESNSSKENEKENNYYISIRNYISILLKKINSSFENSTSTYYLALYYLDRLLNLPNINDYLGEYYKYESNIKKIYIILGVCCLIIATKFNENDPHFQGAYNFLKLSNKYNNYNYYIEINDLVEGEIIILKLLQYKLNFYSVYNFLVFLFGHGIIFEKFLEGKNIVKKNEKKQILEKIYILSREILDLLNNLNTKESIELLNKNNYITAVIILCYSIENILNIKDKSIENIFKKYYEVEINDKNKDFIYNMIKTIYSNKINGNKNKTFRYTYSTGLIKNKKIEFNNFFNKNYRNENKNIINNINNNYIINTINYNQTPNYNYSYNYNNNDLYKRNNNDTIFTNNNSNNNHIKYGENKKIYLNYENNEKEELNHNNLFNNKVYSNEFKKSFSMNHLQNKITSTENNFNYQYNNLIRNNQNNSNTNNYYLNNKIDSYKKDIFIEDNDLIKNNDNDKLNNNYGLKEKYINKKYNSNNKYTSLKKSTSFNEPKNYININDPSLNNYYCDNNKFKINEKYYLKNIISTPNEPLTTINTKRIKLITKNDEHNNFNINLKDKSQSKEKENKNEKTSLYDVIEKTKKIFNMNNNDRNTIIINNNININNFIEKSKHKKQNLTTNNSNYHKLNLNKINKINFDNKIKNYFNYKINYDNGTNLNDINKDLNFKTNRKNINFDVLKKNNNNYINTYYDYSNLNSNNNIINKDYLNSDRRFSYY